MIGDTIVASLVAQARDNGSNNVSHPLSSGAPAPAASLNPERRTLVLELAITRLELARKPQNIEQGMQNDEGERQFFLAFAFVIPCSIFCGFHLPVSSGSFVPVAPP